VTWKQFLSTLAGVVVALCGLYAWVHTQHLRHVHEGALTIREHANAEANRQLYWESRLDVIEATLADIREVVSR